MSDERPVCKGCVEWEQDTKVPDTGKCYLYPTRPQFRKADDTCPSHTPNLLEYIGSPEESEDQTSGSGQPEEGDSRRTAFIGGC